MKKAFFLAVLGVVIVTASFSLGDSKLSESLIFGSYKTVAPQPYTQAIYTTTPPPATANLVSTKVVGLTEQEINQRFVGLLSHARWLLERQPAPATVTGNEQLDLLQRQVLHNMDEDSEDFARLSGEIDDLAADIANNEVDFSDATFTGTTYVNGSLGIGTSSPSDTLAVAGAIYLADITPALTKNRLYNNSGNLYFDGLPVASGGGGSGTVLVGTANTLAYYPVATSTVDDAANLYWDNTLDRLGVGTSSPSHTLSVTGNAYITGNILGATYQGNVITDSYIADNITANNYLSLVNWYATTTDALSEGLTNLYFTTNRFNTNFDARLSATTTLPAITTLANLSLAEAQVSDLLHYSTADFALDLAGTTTDALTEGSTNLYSQWSLNGSDLNYTAGNVGIGTSSPYAKLSVAGNIVATGTITTLEDATSTFAGNLAVNGTATSTFANGISLSAGCFQDASGNCIVSNVAETNSLATTITGIEDTEIFIGTGSNTGDFFAISGDATLANDGTLTLNATNANLTTLANLTTVGTIGTGVWQGTAIGAAYGGTGVTTLGGTNTILYTSALNTLASSSDFVFDGTSLGIGTSSPYAKLSVVGDTVITGTTTALSYIATADQAYFLNDMPVLTGNTSRHNFFLAEAAPATTTVGSQYNYGIGGGALANLTTGDWNFAVGQDALKGAGAGMTGLYNNALGYRSLFSNNTGSYNNALGKWALFGNTLGSYNNALGFQSLASNNTGSHNNAFGFQSLASNNTGSYNNAIGYKALDSNNGTGTIAIGYNAAENALTVDRGIFLGYDIDAFSTTEDDVLNIGNLLFGTGVDGTGTTYSSGNIGIGTSSPYAKLSVVGDTVITGTTTALSYVATADQAYFLNNTPVLTGSTTLNNFFLAGATPATTTVGSQYNYAIGDSALANLTTGDYNFAVGRNALKGAGAGMTGGQNNALGYSALFANTTGFNNNALGVTSLGLNTSGANNNALGFQSLRFNTTGSYNNAIGYKALDSNNGTGTIAIGYNAAENALTVDRGIFLGYDIDAFSTTEDDVLNIGNLLFGTGVDGTGTTYSSGNIGIGTSSPYAKLSVAGNIVATGTITTLEDATSTFAGNLAVNGTATSTFANGITLSAGCFKDASGNCIVSNVAETNSLATTITGIEDTEIFIGTGSNTGDFFAISGDATLANDGTLTLNATNANLTTLANLTTVGTIGTGVWQGTAIGTAYGGTGVTTLGGTNTILYTSALNTLASSSDFVFDGTSLGIGTSSPYAKLSVTGTAGQSNPLFTVASSTNDSYFTILSDGRVSIGSSTPYQTAGLTISNNFPNPQLAIEPLLYNALVVGQLQTATAGEFFVLGEWVSDQYALSHALFARGDGTFGMLDAWSTAYNFDDIYHTGGNVGIGTTTPTALLTVGSSTTNYLTAGELYNSAYVSGSLEVAGNIYGNISSTGTTTALSYVATADQAYFLNDTPVLTGSTTLNNFFLAGAAPATTTVGSQYNYAIGDSALANLTTGDYNFAVGQNALKGAVTGMTGSYNNALGSLSLLVNTTGSNNNALGFGSLISNTTGSHNNASGYWSLFGNTTGQFNNALGYRSLISNTTGSNNNALGFRSLTLNTTGSSNNAFGYQALYSNNGTGTIAIGYNVADNALTVDRGIFLGYDIDAFSTTADDVLNIGNLLFGTGVDGTGTTYSSGNIGIGTSSPYAKLSVAGNIVATGTITTLEDATSTFAGNLAVNGTATSTFANGITLSAGCFKDASGSCITGGGGAETNSLATTITGIEDTEIFIGTGSNTGDFFAISGDATLANDGTLTLNATNANLTTLANLTTVGTIGTGVWQGTAIGTAYGGTGVTTLGGTNTILYTSALNTLASSSDFVFDGTSLGIGTSSPYAKLSVVGDTVITGTTTALSYIATADQAYFLNDMPVLTGNTSRHNFFLAEAAPATTTVGSQYNYGIGGGALANLTTGDSNFAVGKDALGGGGAGMTGGQNNALGSLSLLVNTTGSNNNALGLGSLISNTTGSHNNALGYWSLFGNTTGQSNNASGYRSLISNTTGSHNNAFGFQSLASNNTGSHNNAIGYKALDSNNGTGTIAIGYNAAENALTVDRGIFLGYDIDAFSTTADDVLNIGNLLFGTGVDGTGTTYSSGNIGIGTSSPYAKLSVAGNIVATGTITTLEDATSTFAGNLAVNGTATSTFANGISLSAGCFQDASGNCIVSNVAETNSLATTITGIEDTEIFIGTGSNTGDFFAISGDATLANDGTLTLNATNANLTTLANLTTVGTIGTGVWQGTAIGTAYGGTGVTTLGGTNTILYTSALNTLASSSDFVFDGTSLGIGTSSPYAKLSVVGDTVITGTTTALSYVATADQAYFLNDTPVLTGNTSRHNFFLAEAAPATTTVGSQYNYGIGGGALANLTTGNYNFAVGQDALKGAVTGMTGSFNNALGLYSLRVNTTGSYNNALGYWSLNSNTGGSSNNALGNRSLTLNTTGSYNNALGFQSLAFNTTGSSNNALGFQSLASNNTGSFNNALGSGSLFSNTTGSYNNVFGFGALSSNNGTGTIAIGYQTANNALTVDRGIFIGYDIDAFSTTEDDVLNIGNLLFGTGVDGTGTNYSSGNIGIGTSSPYAKLSVAGQVVGEYFTATSTTATSTFGGDVRVDGKYLLGAKPVLYGAATYLGVGYSNTVDSSGVAVGVNNTSNNALTSAIGYANTASGALASAIGYTNNATGINGIAIGYTNSATNTSAVAIGNMTKAGGLNSVAMGKSINAFGSGSIALGANITNSIASSLMIGVSDSAKLTILSSGNVGIGTTTPSSKLTVTGTTTIGNGNTTLQAGLHIGYGGLCVDDDGTCVASTTGRITGVEVQTGHSDLAETYFSSVALEAGELVTLTGGLSIDRAQKDTDTPVLGVVSTKPGFLLGFDDVSTTEGESSYPIALTGRVPVKLSTENGPIKQGDQLMLSSLPGIATKATGTGATIGIALEDFDDTRMYSDTYVNQFTDGIVNEVYGTTTKETVEAVVEDLEGTDSYTVSLDDDTKVKVGQVVMFVQMGYRWMDESMTDTLAELVSVDVSEISGLIETDGKEETEYGMMATVIKAIKSLWDKVTGVEARLDVLETENATLKERLDKIEAGTVEPVANTSSSGGGQTTPPESTDTTPPSTDQTASTTDPVGSDTGSTTESVVVEPLVDTASSTPEPVPAEPIVTEEETSPTETPDAQPVVEPEPVPVIEPEPVVVPEEEVVSEPAPAEPLIETP